MLLLMLPTTTRKKEREAAIAPNGLVVQHRFCQQICLLSGMDAKHGQEQPTGE